MTESAKMIWSGGPRSSGPDGSGEGIGGAPSDLSSDGNKQVPLIMLVAGMASALVVVVSLLISIDFLSAYLITGYWPY
jgi:hypothetical protein